MQLELVDYSIVATRPLDDDKFITVLAISFKLSEDKKGLFGIKTEQIEIEQNNSMTGFEMDKQCEQESINFVENLSKNDN